jgi:hypothetical protein
VIHGFATGSETTEPGRVANVAATLRDELERLRQRHEQDRAELQKFGIDQPPRYRVMCEGYASRIWEAAASDAERKAKNEELSHKRALFVMELLQGQLDGDHEFAAQGYGAAVRGQYAVVPGAVHSSRPLDPVTESMDPKGVDALEKGATSIDGERYSKKSDDDEVRQVRVIATYEGYKIGHGYGKKQETTIADQ